MRNRFFFITLTALVLAAVGINFVHVHFFKSQRLKLIDRQISESSSILMRSEEFNVAVQNVASIEDTISKVLEGSRIGKVFVLRDEQGKIVYQSFNVGLLKADLPTNKEWVGVKTENEYVRLRNVPLGDKKLVLQVGLVLDRNFIDWEIFDSRVLAYITGIVICLFLASVVITHMLLSPLRHLIGHLKEATSNLINLKDVRPLPAGLTRFTESSWARSDEFASLLTVTQKLIDRINSNHKLTRSWTFQMAHELKTPLAIIRVETEAQRKNGLISEKFSQDIISEVEQMSETITQFLDWAELENSHVQRDLHALRVKTIVKSVAGRLDKIRPGRIHLDLQSDFAVFANPGHLDQLVANLVTNALKFSPESKKVEITVTNHSLAVRDYGLGISKEVKDRLGEPFNVGVQDESGLSGNGLGLAWVSTVSKLYNWDFKIQNSDPGTHAVVRFPKEDY